MFMCLKAETTSPLGVHFSCTNGVLNIQPRKIDPLKKLFIAHGNALFDLSQADYRLRTGQTFVLLRGKQIRVYDCNPAAKILLDNEDLLNSYGIVCAPTKAALERIQHDPELVVELNDLRNDPFIAVAA